MIGHHLPYMPIKTLTVLTYNESKGTFGLARFVQLYDIAVFHLFPLSSNDFQLLCTGNIPYCSNNMRCIQPRPTPSLTALAETVIYCNIHWRRMPCQKSTAASPRPPAIRMLFGTDHTTCLCYRSQDSFAIEGLIGY